MVLYWLENGIIGGFTVHYGLFWTVHGVFVRLFFAPAPGGAVSGGCALALVSLVVSHGTSYVVNLLGRGEDRSRSPLALMQQPYGRVVVLHVTIVGGALVAMLLGHPP